MTTQSKATLETILSHRSIRKFTEQPISEEVFQTLINAGKAASSSNHLQCVSVIRVTDKQIRETLKAVSGMQYVVDCAEFLVFCIDFNKHKQLVPESQLEWAEVSIIGAVDTGIFAQNVLLAAESLGLGGVYIGALRNDIKRVSEALNLPEYCVPLVGMCLGYPAQDPDLKPRLPNTLICHTNQYQPFDEVEFAKYNENLTAYYQARIGEPQQWQVAIHKTLDKPVRPHILPFFNQKGLLKK
ncbi:oxygen-insensitive NADPH nitroreductase [Mannheimia bovis]|uniref:Oxygen-insensitive NADPH nitroreductase n=1 Tax=Mannheimia indoligenes TaxID=3103145 RepID=A0ABU7ZDB4_9PAST|nr:MULTISPECIES: oxygen-insensitive NADPH nitroreductase [Mannheimia]AWW34820.1 oxygen-insensitive NADPH nitroreductase [Mannheimia varigena]WHP46670.1 oxygen-insensitive NADPH nitroreductase [Mannheimia bovis]